MAGSRALPDLIARIRLDSSGVDEAVSNLTGTFGKANLAMAGVAAGLGLIVVGMKSAIDIAIAQDAAQADLAQAFHGNAGELKTYRAEIANFIDGNQAFIKNQAAVIEGFAVLTRQGGDVTRVTRDMGIALDLSATKHIDLGEAVKLVAMAEGGRFKGLIDLGISSKAMVDVNGKLHATTKDVAAAMDELAAKEQGGRQTTSDLDQKTNDLRGHWETLARVHGPKLVEALDKITGAALNVWDAFDRFSADDALWKRINDNLVTVANHITAVQAQFAGAGIFGSSNWGDPGWATRNAVPTGSGVNRSGSGGATVQPSSGGAAVTVRSLDQLNALNAAQLARLDAIAANTAGNRFSTSAYGRS